MSFSKSLISRVPLVVVLGATGTGKTKLGIELAQRFNSEILSADSMQLYKGLNIITAKVTPEEQLKARHHIVDVLDPHQFFTVVDFRNRALKIIEKLLSENRPPIVVGGTMYYIESITWNILVENNFNDEHLMSELDKGKKRSINDESDVIAKQAKLDEKIRVPDENKADSDIDLKVFYEKESQFHNDAVYAKLKQIDPVMAERLHPNNRRKILRAIEVFLKTGKRHSELLDEQHEVENQLRLNGNIIVFWLQCDQEVHDERLDRRIDQMLADGLLEELTDFHEKYNKQRIEDGKPPDYTKGVFQTLGFKCFHPYLMLTEDEKKSSEAVKMLEECVADFKRSTIRYSKRQNRMIQSRFLNHPNRQIPSVYSLDVTDLSKWNEEVKEKAIEIIECHMQEKSCAYTPLLPSSKALKKKKVNKFVTHNCDVCSRIFVGDEQYQVHVNSNKHKKMLKKKNDTKKPEQDHVGESQELEMSCGT